MLGRVSRREKGSAPPLRCGALAGLLLTFRKAVLKLACVAERGRRMRGQKTDQPTMKIDTGC
eukprot:scaffold72525_cov14-Tisochrysis_lutea.AAC.1